MSTDLWYIEGSLEQGVVMHKIMLFALFTAALTVGASCRRTPPTDPPPPPVPCKAPGESREGRECLSPSDCYRGECFVATCEPDRVGTKKHCHETPKGDGDRCETGRPGVNYETCVSTQCCPPDVRPETTATPVSTAR
jgi:hypothetical protein